MTSGIASRLSSGIASGIASGMDTSEKTRENRLLVGPTPLAGFHVLCGLSGYGIMASMGAAEVLGAHVVGAPLPSYARELALARYEDPEYLARLPEIGAGQL